MYRVGRSTYRWLRWGPFLAVVIVGGSLGPSLPPRIGETVGGIASFVAAIWLVFGGWIARALLPVCVSHLTCPACEEEIDAVGVWHCACGYHDHRERHILAFRGPKCDEVDCLRNAAVINT